jgi:zeaxanthin glucosyltransferase
VRDVEISARDLRRGKRQRTLIMLINILMLPEPGHLNATVRLYRELTALGHEVKYLTVKQFERLFAERGLPVSIIDLGGAAPDQAGVDSRLPAFVLADASMPQFALMSWRRGIRVLTLSTKFPFGYDPSVPPICSDLIPSADGDYPARLDAAWEIERQARLAPRPGLAPTGLLSEVEAFRHQAASAGFPAAQIDERSALHISLRLPELVLWVPELDFPRAPREDRLYLGACVDLERVEVDFDFSRLRGDLPLIYCSLGSQLHRYPNLGPRVELLIEAGRLLPQFQFVISGSEPRSNTPPNVLVLRHAPQLQLLRRARLMVSHGGANSVKEALHHGVPLVVLPFDMDQPGNAARLAFHGAGRAVRGDDTTASELATIVRDAADDEALGRRVRAFSAQFAAEHDAMCAGKRLDSYLTSLAQRTPKHSP